MAAESRTRTPAEVAEDVMASFATRDPEQILRHAHPDCVDDFVVLGAFRGHDAIRALYTEMFAAFPDFDIQVRRIVADDRVAAIQWVAYATFSGGPFQGIQPTGRRIELRALDLIEVDDGLVRRNTIYYDGASFARQIGMLPRQASFGERLLIGGFNARTRLAAVLRRRRPS